MANNNLMVILILLAFVSSSILPTVDAARFNVVQVTCKNAYVPGLCVLCTLTTRVVLSLLLFFFTHLDSV
ncbi:hypothetical protein CASFOL_025878 [Castilleja foliolosa]|uniref:Uncharacterized protein n=1 Tax=Castilleja foliolosa TaxID=1961234 RepID=A0ABD3CTJ0_9LAMI